MFKIFLAVLLSLVPIQAIQLPPEPKLPSKVCTILKANLVEGPIGHLHESDESKADTERIQKALDHCAVGQAVKLTKGGARNAFLSGSLNLPSGVTLWIDAGVTLFASRNPRDFDRYHKSCGVIANRNDGCLPLISVKGGRNSAIVGDGVIDGRGGQKMIGSNVSWWQLAGQIRSGADRSSPQLITVENSQNFVLYRIRLHNSPFYHFSTEAVDGLIVWGVKVDTPSKAYPSNTHAPNTDAFDPNGKNMVFTQCYLNAGDDHIAIKGQRYPNANVLIQDNHFYSGHGMSIGSEINQGAVNVTVRNLYIDGAQNGLRIKSDASKGGDVHGILYENVCIRNTDRPLVFNTYYSHLNGSKVPNFHDIRVTKTHILSSKEKKFIFRGFNADVPLKIHFDNVINDAAPKSWMASNVEVTLGPGSVSGLPFKDDHQNNVKVFGHGGKSTPVDCSRAFVPFPR